MLADDVFEARTLGFSLRKPSAWRFVPTQWSPLARWKNAAGEAQAWLQRTTAPFCCAMGEHRSRHHIAPTLQVVARPLASPNSALISTLFEAQLEQLHRTYRNFELLTATSHGDVSGWRATMVRGRFSVTVPVDGVPIEMSVLTRGHVVFAPQIAYSIGLSSSADPAYYDEDELARIIASVTIRA
ncbi:hypothetical protein [Solimonas marina]|uniref:Uncharacterized protein n=1 Tax=Solimonas marina TaxID=2714601 RepID=A0A970B539_9GAMM|nr:hypothetical protein [Solimonas marina]NKF21140.1 hypothetical protein [Solimonas marina]